MTLKFPAEHPQPPLYNASIHLNNQMFTNNIVPIEAALSFPIPLATPHHFAYFQFLPRRDGGERRTTSLSLLTAIEITVMSESPELVTVETLQPVDQGETFLGLPAEIVIAPFEGLRGEEKRQVETALYISASRLASLGYDNVSLEEARQTYRNTLNALVYPELLPYYRALSADL